MAKYKKVSDCHPDLQELLDFLNLLPHDLDSFLKELENLEKIGNKVNEIESLFIAYANNLELELRQILIKRFGDLWILWQSELRLRNRDKKVLSFLISTQDTPKAKEYKKAFEKLNRLNQIKASIEEKLGAKKLFSMIDGTTDEYQQEVIKIMTNDELKMLIDNSPTKEDWALMNEERDKRSEYSANLETELSVNDKGYLDLSLSGLGEIVIREKIKFDRLRICPICDFIFWAKRQNSETCGRKKCIDALGNRKRLAKAKEKSKSKQDFRERWKNQNFSKKDN